MPVPCFTPSCLLSLLVLSVGLVGSAALPRSLDELILQ